MRREYLSQLGLGIKFHRGVADREANSQSAHPEVMRGVFPTHISGLIFPLRLFTSGGN